jgi:hypothetical protein
LQQSALWDILTAVTACHSLVLADSNHLGNWSSASGDKCATGWWRIRAPCSQQSHRWRARHEHTLAQHAASVFSLVHCIWDLCNSLSCSDSGACTRPWN